MHLHHANAGVKTPRRSGCEGAAVNRGGSSHQAAALPVPRADEMPDVGRSMAVALGAPSDGIAGSSAHLRWVGREEVVMLLSES